MNEISTTNEESIEFTKIRQKYPTAIQIERVVRYKLESHLHRLNASKIHLEMLNHRGKMLQDDRAETEAMLRMRIRAIDGELTNVAEDGKRVSAVREKQTKEFKTQLSSILTDAGIDPVEFSDYAPVWENDEIITIAKSQPKTR